MILRALNPYICNDPPGGVGCSASVSGPVRPPSLCACSFPLARSRLLVDILRAHFHTYHSSPRRSPLSLRKKMPLGLRRSNI
ncbi:hypothetical protein T11_12722 [Trichinella zimbabwensis]|uniref:Uncharacterized protein n=1 Tax=Trichinella zimbabwensis TaxID=268475 RepID=A0A0V1GXW2_9BILA|nr:hypothetical protein T11_12722 [Trichinella zimbabwensis]